MFLSINPVEFGDALPALRQFVLDKWERGLPSRLRIYAYYTTSQWCRRIGMAAFAGHASSEVRYVSEVSHAPFGYVLSIDSQPTEKQLIEITNFAKYGYNQFTDFQLRLQCLPTILPYPDDYRSREEVEADRIRNTTTAPAHVDREAAVAFQQRVFRAKAKLNSLGLGGDKVLGVGTHLTGKYLEGLSEENSA